MRTIAGGPRAFGLEREALRARLGTCEDHHREAIAFAMGQLAAFEARALDRLSEDGTRCLEAYDAGVAVCVKKLKNMSAHGTFVELAGRPIRDVEGAVARGFDRQLETLEQLHELRLRIKRLRYTYEIFRSCIDEQHFSRVYKAAKSVQDELGAMNDLHELHERVAAIRDAGSAPEQIRRSLDSFARTLDTEREQAKDRFITWWDSPAREAPAALRDALAGCASGEAEGRTIGRPDIDRGIDRAVDSAVMRFNENGASP